METGLDKEKLLHYKALVLKHLGEPSKLRLVVVCGLVLLSMAGAYVPLSGRITERRARLAEKKRRLDAIREVEALRSEVNSFRGRIPKGADTNDWVRYVLGGLREARVKLRDMASKPPYRVGCYRTVTLSVEVEGTYEELKQFMEWLEQSDRLLRVDLARLEKQSDCLVMRVVLLGLAHKNGKPT